MDFCRQGRVTPPPQEWRRDLRSCCRCLRPGWCSDPLATAVVKRIQPRRKALVERDRVASEWVQIPTSRYRREWLRSEEQRPGPHPGRRDTRPRLDPIGANRDRAMARSDSDTTRRRGRPVLTSAHIYDVDTADHFLADHSELVIVAFDHDAMDPNVTGQHDHSRRRTLSRGLPPVASASPYVRTAVP